MGAAGGVADALLLERCQALGRTIAKRGCCLLTGACPGLPHEAVLGAKALGGHTIGISPAVSLKEHVDLYGSPYKEYDVLVFTGLGLMGRELVNIRSSDLVVVVGGRSGTLGEFAIAYEEGKLIGVLTGSGGITPTLPAIVESVAAAKSTGAEVLYHTEPDRLVDLLLERYLSEAYHCPCYPSDRGAR
ncbi:MAG: protein containing YHS domain protein [Pirellulales bacterium]|nr:protein containing YHS domain protein [Pirellulales bacterium]